MVGPVQDVDGEDDEEVKDKLPRTAVGGLWKLYISRFLTAWGDRMWSFGLGLFLLRVRIQRGERQSFEGESLSTKILRCGRKTC